jgi:peptidoglycan biosynthesis protein MviN/MurJ (putative lipid II flippase)
MDKTPFLIAGLGALATVVTYFVAGAWLGVSAAAGAIVAVANWYVYRWIIDRVIRGNVRQQSALMLLLVGKMGALMALIYLLISRHWVDAVGFVIGISALVAGLFIGSVRYLTNSGPLLENEQKHAPR